MIGLKHPTSRASLVFPTGMCYDENYHIVLHFKKYKGWFKQDYISHQKLLIMLFIMQWTKYSWLFLSRTTLSRISLHLELKSQSFGVGCNLFLSLYLEVSLSRTNFLVPSEFEIERVNCIEETYCLLPDWHQNENVIRREKIQLK